MKTLKSIKENEWYMYNTYTPTVSEYKLLETLDTNNEEFNNLIQKINDIERSIPESEYSYVAQEKYEQLKPEVLEGDTYKFVSATVIFNKETIKGNIRFILNGTFYKKDII